MSVRKDSIASVSQKNINIFLKNFFVSGARDYLRKTTYDAPWLSLGIMEKNCAGLLEDKKLFSDMNIIGGGSYSLGHGFINGYLQNEMHGHIKNAVERLNALPAKEIIFYHDESFHGLSLAREMGCQINFTAVSLIEWLLRKVKETEQVRPLHKNVAVQLPGSMSANPQRSAMIDELFDSIGVRRVKRYYEGNNYLYSGAFGYFGLLSGNIHKDTEVADELVKKILPMCARQKRST